MKIELKKDQIAILREESGEIVACFKSNDNARQAMETAVAEHFDIACCTLSDDRDFNPPFDYEQPYTFCLYLSEDARDEYVTLIMTYGVIY